MLDTRLRGYDVYGFYQILIALLSFPRRRESRKWENSTFYETIKLWQCSFTRAPPLAASVQSDRKRNFKVLNLLFLDCGSGF